MFFSATESVLSIAEPKPDRQRKPVSQLGGLGANQIAWLRANVPAFSDAWKALRDAETHKARVYSKMNVEPGSVGVPSQKEQVQS